MLFEMLTGQRAFAGETLSDVLDRIIEHEPDWQTLPVRTPAAIRRLLRRCLEKDPMRRLDSAAVARIEIDEAAREPTAVVEAAGTRPGSLWRPIAWAATGAGVAVLVTMMTAGGARPTERPGPLVATSFVDAGVVEDLLFVPLTGDRRLEPVFQAPGVERNPAIAPSGRFLAYNSDESGTSQVYVRPFPNAGSRKWQVSTDGGAGPVWTRGGSEIVYQDSQGSMVAVAVLKDRDGEFDYSKPEPLFKVGPGWTRGLDRGWDVTADGERFLLS